jgi:hypothetical protein
MSLTHDNFSAQIVARDDEYEWTQGELSALFTRVQNAQNWKRPIDAVVSFANDREREGTRAAVTFFTGSEARIAFTLRTTADGHGLYRVTAAGYYVAIGA